MQNAKALKTPIKNTRKQGTNAQSVLKCVLKTVTRNGRKVPLAPDFLQRLQTPKTQKRRFQDRGTPARPPYVLDSLPPRQLISRKEMCGHLQVSIALAEKWGQAGTGPKITHCYGQGGIRPWYRVKDVLAFRAEYENR